eukprot:scaffold7407_cov165-Cylindrotheca_fusiformis.AAC.1
MTSLRIDAYQREFQQLADETSRKFVPKPSHKMVIGDACIMLKRLRHALRWKEFLRLNPPEENEISQQQQRNDHDQQDLGTGVRPDKVIQNPAPIGSREFENMFDDFERQVFRNIRTSVEPSPKSLDVEHTLKKLGHQEDLLAVSTDKTNSFRIVDKEAYIQWMNEEIRKSAAQEVPPATIEDAQRDGHMLLDHAKSNRWFPIGKKEAQAIEQSLRSCSVPTPFLLIKDHKPRNQEGHHPTRLVIPAQNFVSGFPKVGYKAIRQIFDENNINYKSRTIIQARDLKSTLENCRIRRNHCTILSLDIVDMYPSISFKLVKKAIKHFSANLSRTLQRQINFSLQFLQFGMNHTYFMFGGKYYQYNANKTNDEKGLTIGGFESAWLADLVASYILEKLDLFFIGMHYHGIYRDDGIVVFNHVRTPEEVAAWLQAFQSQVDNLCTDPDGTKIADVRFKAVIWAPGATTTSTASPHCTICPDPFFLYLDIEMYWGGRHRNGTLNFRVHTKENQRLHYLTKGSAHTMSTYRAIPRN